MAIREAKKETWKDRKSLPSIRKINEYISYEPATGLFTYKAVGKFGLKENTTLGAKASRGYMYIRIAGVKYYAHRIAYKLRYRDEPYLIDHINGIKSDNRIINLRKATLSENGHNRKNNKNKILPKGIRKRIGRKTFEARISINNKPIHLGSFLTLPEAEKAYLFASNNLKNNIKH